MYGQKRPFLREAEIADLQGLNDRYRVKATTKQRLKSLTARGMNDYKQSNRNSPHSLTLADEFSRWKFLGQHGRRLLPPPTNLACTQIPARNPRAIP